MIAWLAPGQGMEQPGSERAVAARYPCAARLLEGLAPGLHSTALVQPWLTAVALGAACALREEGVPCDLVAGHSVGELAAWSIAGGLTPEEAIALARARGVAMATAAAENPGGMWAFDAATAPDPPPDGLVLAVHNPGQVVLSGPEPGPVGGRRVATSGAWHSPAMAAARDAFAAAIAAVPERALQIPLVSNHDGRPTTDDATVRRHLVEQLTHPVRWTAVLDTLRELGVTEVVLLGPSKVLAHHLRQAGWPRHRVSGISTLLFRSR